MSIIYREDLRTFYLNTKNTTYAFFINELGLPEHLYYGKKIGAEDIRYAALRHGYSFTPFDKNVGNKVSPDVFLQEYPTANGGDYRICAFAVKDGDGYFGARLKYKNHSIFRGRKQIDSLPCARGDGAETLEVTLESEESKTEVKLYYVVYEEFDVITRHEIITNFADKSAFVLKANTALDLYGCDYDLIDLFGMYHCERSMISRNPLSHGRQGNFSVKGSSGHETNPFFVLCRHDATEDCGEVYGFNFVYSGNFANDVQVTKENNTRVIIGISDYLFDWKLDKNESFSTPETIMTYTDRGIGEMSRIMHDFVRVRIIPEKFAFSHRPVVLNTWEAFGFDIDLKKITEIAKCSKEMGAELVVIDDGWFRNDDTEGLGDWKVIKEKFPNGIKEVSDTLHSLGLQFGLWFEPEMINEKSDLFSAHPEWVIGTNAERYVARHQLVLDMGNPAVVDYLAGRIFDCLDGVKIEYMKWDMNRYVSEVGSSAIPNQGEVFHRYVLGVYRLLSMVSERYPDMLIETCSGGGGRFDLGMLYYSPQIWTSDDTDPYIRSDIQTGTSLAYPPSSMSCHFTSAKISGIDADSDFRFRVANFGAYGYEMDPTAISAQRRAELAEYTKLQKRYENVMLSGDLYRIITRGNGEYSSYVQVAKDKSAALFTFIQFAYTPLNQQVVVRLKGLNEDFYYRSSDDGKVYSGAVLTNVGLRMDGIVSKSGYTKQIYFEKV